MKNKFTYRKLNKFLEDIGNKNIKEVELEFLVSMEKDYYAGSAFFELIENFKSQVLNNSRYVLDENNNKYDVKKVRFKVCDTLNRYNLYYRDVATYIQECGLAEESQVPEDKRKELADKTYEKGKKQGEDWFVDNINAINLLIPKSCKLSKNLKLNDEITTLYEGDDNNPCIEYIRYEYWANHPKYNEVEKALREVCDLEDSVIQRGFLFSIDYFIERLKGRKEAILFEDLLRKQSYKYLFDEVVSFAIKHGLQDNLIEFYSGERETSATETFRGRKAQNDPIIQQYLQGPLKGADQRKFVTVKMVEEDK